MVNSAHFSGSRSAELLYMEGGNCFWVNSAHLSGSRLAELWR